MKEKEGFIEFITRGPKRGEGFHEYVFPRAAINVSVFALVIAVLCVVGEYMPTEGLLK